ncbi:MAG: hypothetical protein B6D53_04535 [Candidatus Omnitrophica bacterium 4484_49]|nr:MAG: hypothetical protein B6D53_04535 [Candidatus Omnitrophica bacterium 4484_49]
MNLEIFYNRLPEKLKHILSQLFKLGKEMNIKLYLVGGPVRDLILNREVLDLDLVVNRDLEVLLERLREEFSFKIEPTRFLTAKVYFDDFILDIAETRKEYYPLPGALPEVSPGTLKSDAYRRDFTINALYLEITTNGFSKLIDYVGGVKDLQKKIIRVLKRNSFYEDPTRIIRAVRYEQRFGFKMETGTLSLLKKAVKENVFSTVTPQRLGAEFIRTLREKNVFNPLRRLDELCGFDFLNVSIKLTSEKISSFKRWDSYKYKRDVLCPEIIPLMILLSDLELLELDRISQILELTRAQRSLLKKYVRLDKEKILSLLSKKLSVSKIYDRLNNLDFEIVVCLHLLAKGQARRNLDLYLKKLVGLRLEVTGEDVKNLGIAQGPQIGHLLERLKKARLEGKVKTREDEIRYIKKLGDVDRVSGN